MMSNEERINYLMNKQGYFVLGSDKRTFTIGETRNFINGLRLDEPITIVGEATLDDAVNQESMLAFAENRAPLPDYKLRCLFLWKCIAAN